MTIINKILPNEIIKKILYEFKGLTHPTALIINNYWTKLNSTDDIFNIHERHMFRYAQGDIEHDINYDITYYIKYEKIPIEYPRYFFKRTNNESTEYYYDYYINDDIGLQLELEERQSGHYNHPDYLDQHSRYKIISKHKDDRILENFEELLVICGDHTGNL